MDRLSLSTSASMADSAESVTETWIEFPLGAGDFGRPGLRFLLVIAKIVCGPVCSGVKPRERLRHRFVRGGFLSGYSWRHSATNWSQVSTYPPTRPA